jgi:hypothetical protein
VDGLDRHDLRGVAGEPRPGERPLAANTVMPEEVALMKTWSPTARVISRFSGLANTSSGT